jgi:hypothetical protein
VSKLTLQIKMEFWGLGATKGSTEQNSRNSLYSWAGTNKSIMCIRMIINTSTIFFFNILHSLNNLANQCMHKTKKHWIICSFSSTKNWLRKGLNTGHLYAIQLRINILNKSSIKNNNKKKLFIKLLKYLQFHNIFKKCVRWNISA